MINKQLEKKLNEYIKLLEGMVWNMAELPKGHHEFFEDMINWLKSSLGNMEILNKQLAVDNYLFAIQFMTYQMLQYITESPNIKKITQPALYQVWLDLKFIEEHMTMVTSISVSDIKTSMRGFYQTLMLLLMADINEYLDSNKRQEKYKAVKGLHLLKICERFHVIF